MLFKRNKVVMHGGNPQYLPGTGAANDVAVASNIKMKVASNPAVTTTGFDESDLDTYSLSYGNRSQPDVGGALNYAYENYGLPLNNVCGPYMVATHPTKPIGSQPVQYFQVAPVTSLGGLVPGQVISQPLLNPNDPYSGIDIYS